MTRARPEDAIQADIVAYLRNVLPTAIVAHVKNQGNRGGRLGAIDGARGKKLGVVAGMPDLMVLVEPGKTFFFEVKDRTGYASMAQQYLWQKLRTIGFECALVRSVDEARNALKAWGIRTREAGGNQ